MIGFVRNGLSIIVASAATLLSSTLLGQQPNNPCNYNYLPPPETVVVNSQPLFPISLWVELDFLYWKTIEDGLEVGASNLFETVTSTGTASEFTVREKDLNFQWSSGFRLGFGSGFDGYCNPDWKSSFFWTHLSSHASHHDGVDVGARWKIALDMIDAMFGRDIGLGASTNVTFSAGIRAAKIRQQFHAALTNTLEAPQGISLIQVTEKSHSNFYGLGPRFGIDAEWIAGCGFSVYGSVGLTALFGHFNTKFRETDLTTTAVDACDESESISACQAVTDAALGLRWNYTTCNRFRIECLLGFEHHQFYHQNRICESGDLCFDGLIAGFRFGF